MIDYFWVCTCFHTDYWQQESTGEYYTSGPKSLPAYVHRVCLERTYKLRVCGRRNSRWQPGYTGSPTKWPLEWCVTACAYCMRYLTVINNNAADRIHKKKKRQCDTHIIELPRRPPTGVCIIRLTSEAFNSILSQPRNCAVVCREPLESVDTLQPPAVNINISWLLSLQYQQANRTWPQWFNIH